MAFGALPPEIISARMYSGPGSGPMMAAAAAWNGAASELNSTARSYGAVITRLTDEQWMGPASVSMAGAAAPYVAWMNGTAAQAELAGRQAQMAAAAYEQAYAMTVPPPVIAANRTRLLSLLQTNILGQNAPAIAATETQYAEMWAQDTLAMHTYAAHSAMAAKLEPFSPPPQTTTPAGGVAQAAAVSHAAATKTLASTPKALQMLASPSPTPTGTTPATSSGSTSPLSSLDSIFKSPTLSAANSTYSNFIHSANFGARGICAVWRGLSGGMGAAKMAGAGAAKAASGAAKAAEGAANAAGGLSGLGGMGGGLGGVTGGIGSAGSIGGLSVPPSWAPAAPAATAFGPVSGGTWEASGPSGMLGEAPLGAPPGVPGMPGVAGPAGMGGIAARATGFSGPPRYGVKPVVMPRLPIGG